MRQSGLAASDILDQLAARQAAEPDVHAGRLFGLVYPSGRADVEELVIEVNRRYLFGNALNPFRFPELANLEKEVVGAVARLLHRPETEQAAGCLTSGGTESILLAMLSYRERAKARGIDRPQIVAPRSAHPAYAKAAHYFGMELVLTELSGDWCADLAATRHAVTDRTAVLVASAFSYPYGVMDPVDGVAAIAAESGAGCHVDACIGAFILPFLEHLGHHVPPFDFRVPGVTTISADVHKYGYVPKGASVVLHRADDWFWQQGFVYEQWGAGIYGSAAIAGARPAAPVACSWAVINYLGADGYTEIVRGLMDSVATVKAALPDDVNLVGAPIGPVLALQSEAMDVYAVADVMDDRGWHLNRNTTPHSLHLMLSPGHSAVLDQLVADLTDAFEIGRGGAARQGTARYS